MTEATGNSRRRVLITDGEARAALAACRALRRAGYEVDAVASRPPAAVHWSRYCSRRLLAPDPRVDKAAFVASLNRFLDSRRYDVLLPASDAALLAISEDRNRLSRLVAIGLPRHEVVLRCLSKTAVFEASQASQLAAPKTELCRTLDEAREAAAGLGFPLLVKPHMSARPEGTGLWERSSQRVSTESDLAATIEDFGLPILVQRYLRGPVYSLGGVITDRGLVAAAYSRYVRTWPPEAGNVSCSLSLPLPSELRDAAATLLGRMGWQGIFELELMEKPDGDLGVIDLNPRVYGSLELAIRAGASLPAIWCESLLEGTVASELDARAGVWYRWEDAEVRYALRRIRSGGISEIAAMLRPRHETAHAFFRMSDPGPLLARVISAVRGRHQGRRHQRHPGAGHNTPTAGSAA